MSASQPAYFHLQEFSDGGVLLVGGRLYTYTQGTTALKVAYTDPAGAVPQTYTADGAGGQYIALNARGELPAPLYLAPGAYDIALKRADGSTVWTRRADPTGDGPAAAAVALAAPTGAGLLGWIRSAIGAVATTLDKWMGRQTLNLFDFMTDAQISDVQARTRMIDVTVPFNKAIVHASLVKKALLAPSGSYLLGTLTFIDPTGVYATRGQRIWALLFAKSDVTIFGEGDATELFVAGGLVGTNYNLPGTKGFQVFVNELPTTAVNNFKLRDLVINYNGFNNKLYPINADGNQSLCHGVSIETGDNVVIENVRHVDNPGHQVIRLGSSTTNCRVKHNRFYRCGWLDGTNNNLLDHSSIYTEGTDFKAYGNRLEQTLLMPFGCAIEMHGTGEAYDNEAVKYGCLSITAALVKNAAHSIHDNRGIGLASGLNVYAGAGFTLDSSFRRNDITLSAEAVGATTPTYTVRNAVYAGYANIGAGPGNLKLDISRNKFKMVGAIGWATDAEDLYNAAVVTQLINELTVRDNVFQGFRGAVHSMDLQSANASAIWERNSFVGCGRKDAYVDNNSVVNYANAGRADYGNTPYELQFTGNTFTGCLYANYLNLTGVAGALLTPTKFTVVRDKHDRWLSCISVLAGQDVALNATLYEFRYHVAGMVDATKPFPTTANVAKNTFGEITANQFVQGWPCTFRSFGSIAEWNFDGYTFADAAPLATPFGNKQGDVYRVLRAAASGNSGYYYTGIAWKSFGVLTA